jgi:atypical dual specificity phosphatase
VNQVRPWLWIGDQDDGVHLGPLLRTGITAVFNATTISDNWPADARERIAYLRIDQDDGQPIPEEKLARFFDFLRAARDEGRVLLVHCGAGVSRAAAFCIAALMAVEALDWDLAEAEVRRARPIIGPAAPLKQSVLAYFAAYPEPLLP